MKKIVPTIWLDGQAEEAAQYYCDTFDNSKIIRTDYYSEAGKEIHGHEQGDVLTVSFEVEGQQFIALNGGPQFKITPAISFSVHCNSVEEVDALWSKLIVGGSALMPLDTYPFSKRYGWVADRFGVSWQLNYVDNEVAQKIIPSLLFTQLMAGKAEEAMNFYTSVFPESAIGTLSRYPAGQEPEVEGTINYGEFKIFDYQMIAMDSAQAHEFVFTEGVSLVVNCDTQEEIDTYWNALSAVPEAEACGWLRDKYGVSWQIEPSMIDEMQATGTPEQLERVMAAFMQMKKVDIAALERAFHQNAVDTEQL